MRLADDEISITLPGLPTWKVYLYEGTNSAELVHPKTGQVIATHSPIFNKTKMDLHELFRKVIRFVEETDKRTKKITDMGINLNSLMTPGLKDGEASRPKAPSVKVAVAAKPKWKS